VLSKWQKAEIIVFGFQCSVFGKVKIEKYVSGFKKEVPSTKYQVPSIKYQVPSTKYQVPSTKYQVLNIVILAHDCMDAGGRATQDA
jgi:hypothetical protein